MRKNRPLVHLAIEVDSALARADHVEAMHMYWGKWIHTARVALGWTAALLGEKLGLSQQAISRLEQRESSELISIRSLRQVAEALDCRLVYGFVPNAPMAATALDLRDRQEDARRRRRAMPRPGCSD